ncbi:MAG: DUF799 domain-containing protein [Janthinobacterium lividum]
MHSFFKTVCLALMVATLAACASSQSSYDYRALRASKPRSILVLPPENHSPDVRATYSFLSVATAPLAEAGYYVFPVALVDQTFKENGLSLPGEMFQAPLGKIGEIFGADAALYITIEQYGAVYQVIDSSVTVSASARLVDVRTGELLWEGRAKASNAEGRNNNAGGVASLLVTALIRQVAGNVGDPAHGVAAIASQRLLSGGPNGLLPGPRSPYHQAGK